MDQQQLPPWEQQLRANHPVVIELPAGFCNITLQDYLEREKSADHKERSVDVCGITLMEIEDRPALWMTRTGSSASKANLYAEVGCRVYERTGILLSIEEIWKKFFAEKKADLRRKLSAGIGRGLAPPELENFLWVHVELYGFIRFFRKTTLEFEAGKRRYYEDKIRRRDLMNLNLNQLLFPWAQPDPQVDQAEMERLQLQQTLGGWSHLFAMQTIQGNEPRAREVNVKPHKIGDPNQEPVLDEDQLQVAHEEEAMAAQEQKTFKFKRPPFDGQQHDESQLKRSRIDGQAGSSSSGACASENPVHPHAASLQDLLDKVVSDGNQAQHVGDVGSGAFEEDSDLMVVEREALRANVKLEKGPFHRKIASGEILKIECGTTSHRVLEECLREHKYFYQLFNFGKITRIDKDTIFINRDGTHFALILNFIRDGKVHLPKNETDLLNILTEAEHYRLTKLVQLCKTALEKYQ